MSINNDFRLSLNNLDSNKEPSKLIKFNLLGLLKFNKKDVEESKKINTKFFRPIETRNESNQNSWAKRKFSLKPESCKSDELGFNPTFRFWWIFTESRDHLLFFYLNNQYKLKPSLSKAIFLCENFLVSKFLLNFENSDQEIKNEVINTLRLLKFSEKIHHLLIQCHAYLLKISDSLDNEKSIQSSGIPKDLSTLIDELSILIDNNFEFRFVSLDYDFSDIIDILDKTESTIKLLKKINLIQTDELNHVFIEVKNNSIDYVNKTNLIIPFDPLSVDLFHSILDCLEYVQEIKKELSFCVQITSIEPNQVEMYKKERQKYLLTVFDKILKLNSISGTIVDEKIDFKNYASTEKIDKIIDNQKKLIERLKVMFIKNEFMNEKEENMTEFLREAIKLGFVIDLL